MLWRQVTLEKCQVSRYGDIGGFVLILERGSYVPGGLGILLNPPGSALFLRMLDEEVCDEKRVLAMCLAIR